jgi:uncharacterized membrane protein
MIVRFPLAIWVGFALLLLLVGGWCLFKYHFFLYDGLDLGIFDQVIWNSSQGRLYQYSFAPYLYLVDHRPWLLLLLVPLYWVAAHPLTLLLVQTVVIASSIFPAFLVAERVFGRVLPTPRAARRAASVAALLLLVHPSVVGMAVYEFHLLPLALPLSLWLWWALTQEPRRWRLATALVVALLLLREDLSLMLVGIGWMLLWEPDRRLRRFGAVTAAAGVAWFVAMFLVGSAVSPSEVNTFAVFYESIGGTPAGIAQTAWRNPTQLLAVFFGFDHLLLLWYLVATFAVLPLLRWRRLLPLVLPLGVYLLMDRSVSGAILLSHLAAPLLPWLYIAAVEGYGRLHQLLANRFPAPLAADLHRGLAVLVVGVVVGHAMMVGPYRTVREEYFFGRATPRQDYLAAIAAIGPEEAVLVTNRLWPRLSQRQRLYTPLHLYWNRHYHSGVPYAVPDQVDWMVLEHDAIVRYGISVPLANRAGAGERLSTIIETNGLVPVLSTEEIFVLGQPQPGQEEVTLIERSDHPLANPADKDLNGDLRLLDWESDPQANTLTFRLEKIPGQAGVVDDQHLRLRWYGPGDQVIKEKFFALGFGFDPTIDWQVGETPRRLTIPVRQLDKALRVEAAFGPVVPEFDNLLIAEPANLVLDPAQTTVVPLPGVSPSRNR